MAHLFHRLPAVVLCAGLLLLARAAAAQPRTYVEGLAELTTAIAGTYADEGPRIAPALDTMTRGLAQWDQEIQAFEAQVASELHDAAPSPAARLRTELAARYAQRARFSDALRELDIAISLDPLALPAHFLRGQVLDALSRSTDAGEAFRLAWTRNRQDPIAAYHLLRHAATIDPQDVHGAQDTLHAAYRTLLDGRPHEKSSPFPGIDVFQQGAGEAFAVAPVIYRKGYAYIARGQYAEAIAAFRTAAAADPLISDPVSRSSSMTRAIAAFKQGRTADARALVERTEGFGESSEAHRVLALIDWTDAEYDTSAGELAIAIQKNPRDERSRVALSRVLSSAGRSSDAQRVLNDTLQILPDSALACVWLGSGYEELNQLLDARQAFERAAPDVTVGRGAFFATIARLAGATGDVPGAIDAWSQSIAASPNDPELHKRLARSLLQQDRADEAFRELVATVLIDPGDAGAHLGIGQILLNAGRLDDAVGALRRSVQLSPGYVEARYALATALSRLGRTGEAAQEFARVEQAQQQEMAERRRVLALATLKEEAALRVAEGDYERAVTLWTQAIEREPGRPAHHVSLAGALAGAGRIDAAIEQYEIAIRLGADPLVYRQLANVYASAGRADEAARARASYTRALQSNAATENPRPVPPQPQRGEGGP